MANSVIIVSSINKHISPVFVCSNSIQGTFLLLLISLTLFCSCKKAVSGNNNQTWPYQIKGNKIYSNNQPVELIGTNALHVFSAGGSDMNSWHIDIAREFIGNVKQEPLTGNVILDANGSYLYPLQTIVDSNRANNRITILCPFGWDGTASTVFSGTMPAKTYWWNNLKNQLQQWAIQFVDQPDVWLEVWNEPYNYNRSDGYTDDIWVSDMNTLVSVIRNTGNKNIILVPCAEQGQDESVLNNKGQSFLSGKSNILFDIHAYEDWLLIPVTQMGSRLRELETNDLPVLFGETGPMNAGVLMNPAAFLDSIHQQGLSACAWVWKYDSTDADALLTQQGLPNNNANNDWGNLYKALCLSIRNP